MWCCELASSSLLKWCPGRQSLPFLSLFLTFPRHHSLTQSLAPIITPKRNSREAEATSIIRLPPSIRTATVRPFLNEKEESRVDTVRPLMDRRFPRAPCKIYFAFPFTAGQTKVHIHTHSLFVPMAHPVSEAGRGRKRRSYTVSVRTV